MNYTKEELMAYFQSTDVAVLQKLRSYADLLIIPDEDMLVNVNMVQMVAKANSLADSLFPAWTDRSKTDFGAFLVELFAIFSEKDFWYINAFANEGILRKMRSYSNAFSKSSTLGYQPETCSGASFLASVSFEEGVDTYYGIGDLTLTVGGVNFVNTNPFTLAAKTSTFSQTVQMSEGEMHYKEIPFTGYSTLLDSENIDMDSIVVAIGGIEYTRVRNFGESSASSSHYLLLPEENGSVNIFFGSNGYGVTPPVGVSVQVYYRLCNTTAGNLPIGVITVTDSLTGRKAMSATMLTVSKGGKSGESITTIKEKAPLFFGTKRTVINEVIAVQILNSFPSVLKSNVNVLASEVKYQVIPTSGALELTADELLVLGTDFEPYVLTGYNASHYDNDYTELLGGLADADKLILEVNLSKGVSSVATEAIIRQVIDDVTTPQLSAEYGVGFSKDVVDTLIKVTASGVQSVTFKYKKTDTTELLLPDILLTTYQIFKKFDQSKLIVRITLL